MLERSISVADVLTALNSGATIEDYPDGKVFPSRLNLGWVEGRPVHVVWATAAGTDRVVIQASVSSAPGTRKQQPSWPSVVIFSAAISCPREGASLPGRDIPASGQLPNGGRLQVHPIVLLNTVPSGRNYLARPPVSPI